MNNTRLYMLTWLNWMVGVLLCWYAWTGDMPQREQIGWCIFGLMYLAMDTPTRDDGGHVCRVLASFMALLLAAWLIWSR